MPGAYLNSSHIIDPSLKDNCYFWSPGFDKALQDEPECGLDIYHDPICKSKEGDSLFLFHMKLTK